MCDTIRPSPAVQLSLELILLEVMYALDLGMSLVAMCLQYSRQCPLLSTHRHTMHTSIPLILS